MSALLDSMAQAFCGSDARREVLDAALRDGLPAARNEAWKYTSLRQLERRAFAAAPLQGPALDAALLDVNVAGQEVFPIAEALKARGVPFVFSTGYGESGLPEHWRGNPTVQKPFTDAAIRDALMAALNMSMA